MNSQSFVVGMDGLPDLDGAFGAVLEGDAMNGRFWTPMNWKHNAISSEGFRFGEQVYTEAKPFYTNGKFAYPITEDAREDFFRAGYVGRVRQRENPDFKDFYNAIAMNADAVWIPGRMWDYIQNARNRNNFKHWLVECKNTDDILRGYIARLGRTRIYTDAFANSWSEQFLNDCMYTLKAHDTVERRADPIQDLHICLVQGKRGKIFMLEKDRATQVRHIFDLLERCPPPELRVSSVDWDKVLQEE